MAQVDEPTPATAPGVLQGGPPVSWIESLDASADGLAVELEVGFADFVVDQSHPIRVSVDGSESLVPVSIEGGTTDVALPLVDPCTQLGSAIEVGAAYGSQPLTRAVVEVPGVVADPGDGVVAVDRVPVASCDGRTDLRVYVEGGRYTFDATGGLSFGDGSAGVDSSGRLDLALESGTYTVHLHQPVPLVVVPW